MSHQLDCNLVTDPVAMAALQVNGRRKVRAILDRIDYLSEGIRGAHEKFGTWDSARLRERAALRWVLWKLGVVTADHADAEWTAEHGGAAPAPAEAAQ